MKIKKCFNVDRGAILDKKYNVFYAISLGNKYFTQERVKGYLLWGMKNTKDKVAVVIPDKIHAVNYEVREKCSSSRAMRLAKRNGDALESMVNDIIDGFPDHYKKNIKVLRWEDIEKENSYTRKTEILFDEFEKNQDFRGVILDIVRNIFADKNRPSILNHADRLSEYLLNELPMIIEGVKYQDTVYDLYPYPSDNLVFRLVVAMQQGEAFPEIIQRMKISSQARLVEGYAEEVA